MEQTARKRIVVGVSGASGAPLAAACLTELRRHPEWEIHLIVSRGGAETIRQETGLTPEGFSALAHVVHDNRDIGAGPASGTFKTQGMLIVPCSMKTVSGIASGYSDSLLLRAADVTIKEHRPLVLAARETPLSPIHLRNLEELSRLPQVWIVPPMLSFYQKPETVEDLIAHMACKLLAPFGIEPENYRRWDPS